jgi:hypothetical protein
MRWEEHMAGMEEKCIQSFGQKNLMERVHLEDKGFVGWIILK